MDIRKFNNLIKRQLIDSVAHPGYKVLDVGCGCGGDLFKWLDHGVELYACDPDPVSIREARRRVAGKKCSLFVGDISVAPKMKYDIICYNFSLQYIFETRDLFENAMQCIYELSHEKTKFIGVIPDSDFIMQSRTYSDQSGNYITREQECLGEFGEHIQVYIKGAPYYKNGPRPEPIAYKDVLFTRLENMGYNLYYWRPFTQVPVGRMTDLYSEFVFIFDTSK